jgi:hypothetical protein
MKNNEANQATITIVDPVLARQTGNVQKIIAPVDEYLVMTLTHEENEAPTGESIVQCSPETFEHYIASIIRQRSRFIYHILRGIKLALADEEFSLNSLMMAMMLNIDDVIKQRIIIELVDDMEKRKNNNQNVAKECDDSWRHS